MDKAAEYILIAVQIARQRSYLRAQKCHAVPEQTGKERSSQQKQYPCQDIFADAKALLQLSQPWMQKRNDTERKKKGHDKREQIFHG